MYLIHYLPPFKSDCGKLAEEILAASKDCGDLVPEDILVHVCVWTSLTASHVVLLSHPPLLLSFDYQVAPFGYGHKGQNPIKHMHFYCKDRTVKTFREEEVSHMLPQSFSAGCVRVYFTKEDPELCEAAKK